MAVTHESITVIDLQPHPMVQRFAADVALQDGVSLEILDIGSGCGKNSRYLAQLGHTTLGIDKDPKQISLAEKHAYAAGVANNCQYLQKDVLSMPSYGRQFDALLICDMLHLLPKIQSTNILLDAAHLVRPGGYHLISGYVADPTVVSERNREQCLKPGELIKAYASKQWEVVYLDEIRRPATPRIGASELVNSVDHLIARKKG